MNEEIKTRWIEALRSGEYEQGHGNLKNDGKFCCLGVLCELAVQDGVIERKDYEGEPSIYAEMDAVLPTRVRRWAGLFDSNPDVLWDGRIDTIAHVNDCEVSFETIATIIETQL